LISPLDQAHEPLQPIRRLGAQIRVIHAAQLLGDGKQRLGAQADDVVVRLFVLVRHGHRGLAYSSLSRASQPRPNINNASPKVKVPDAGAETRVWPMPAARSTLPRTRVVTRDLHQAS